MGAGRSGGSPGGSSVRALVLVVLAVMVTQAGVQAARPLVSYRVIALDGGGTAIGLSAAAFAALSLLLAVPLGRWTDRTGRTLRVFTCGAVSCVVAAAALALAPAVWVVALASTAFGLAHVLLMIGAQGFVARASSDTDLDRNFGLLTAALSAGQLLGPLLTGFALGSSHSPSTTQTTTAGWVVVAVAALGIPFSLWAAMAARRQFGIPVARPRHDPGLAALSSRALLGRPGIRPALLTSLALLTAVDLLTAYLPLIAEERSIAPATVGLLLAVRAAASLASRAGLGWLAGRWSRAALVTASTAGAAVMMLVVALPLASLWVLVPTMVIGGFLLGIGQPLTMTQVVQSVGSEARSTALALRLVANRLGQVTLPTVAGLVAGGVGAAGALALSAAVLAVAAGVSSRTRT